MTLTLFYLLVCGLPVVAVLTLLTLLALFMRVVVSTNEVHIVQSAKHTISYGKGQDAGNSYYKWPAWVPSIGITVSRLPVSVFNVTLTNYAAYDKGRVPFQIDITAFFRIADSNIAAQRVNTTGELREQLNSILQGACRSILATSEIEEILEGRSKFGQMFTDAVEAQLKEWGLTNVKNIELMDIRDAEGSKVIGNIMAKKKSLIERESRVAVAENQRAAQEAEIVAQREVNLRAQEAEQQVGIRSAEKLQQIGIAEQIAQQLIKDQTVITTTKTMQVRQVEVVRAAEIERDQKVILADQSKQTKIIDAEAMAAVTIAVADGQAKGAIRVAEGTKAQTALIAEGNLQSNLRTAEGIEAVGRATGEAEKAKQLASVVAQTTLAKEIGDNKGYQEYLLGVRTIEANQVVGVAQADALKAAQIKVIANTGSVNAGVTSAMELLSAKGGTALGSMVEAFANTDTGGALLKKIKPALNGAAHA